MIEDQVDVNQIDVVDWTEEADPEQEQRLPVIARVLADLQGQVTGNNMTKAINRELQRAGLVALEPAELFADIQELDRRGARIQTPAPVSDQPWEELPGEPPPEPDPEAERLRIIETSLNQWWEYWIRQARRYPLRELAPRAEHHQADRDRRQLLDAVNVQLRMARLRTLADGELLTLMARWHRVMAPFPPPPFHTPDQEPAAEESPAPVTKASRRRR